MRDRQHVRARCNSGDGCATRLLAQNNTHTVGFSWDGDLSLSNWPDDEYSALQAGIPFADFLPAETGAGRSVRIMAHSLGNLVVNSALVRPEAQPALSSGLVKSFVMNEAAIPAEAFDTSYSSANQSLILTLQSSLGLGYSDDSEWTTEWSDMQTNHPDLVSKWNTTTNSSFTRPQPIYYSRWTQQRPAGLVPDSDAGATPERGPWLGFFAANPGRVTMTNTFSKNDSVLDVIWYSAQTTEKPNSNGNASGVTVYPAITLTYNDESQQYWATLSNTGGAQELLWNNICDSSSPCLHSNIIRQWAELAYWFPATATAAGNHQLNSIASYDFTQYDPLSLNPANDVTPTHSYMKVAPYPSVWQAWQQVNGALK